MQPWLESSMTRVMSVACPISAERGTARLGQSLHSQSSLTLRHAQYVVVRCLDLAETGLVSIPIFGHAGLKQADATMAVLLQEMLQPELSFVLHTQNPMDRQAFALILGPCLGQADALLTC